MAAFSALPDEAYHAAVRNGEDVFDLEHLIEPSVEDADGQEYNPINLIILSGTFKPGPEYSKAKLRPGESFTGCSPVLVPEGKDFERVRFQGNVTEDPVFWKPE